MRFFKRVFAFLFLSFVIFMLAGGFCIFYAFQIEPYRLKVKEYTLNEQENGAEDIKVVQFSDLHIKEDYTAENLEKVVDKINAQNPDVVVFTGDLYDNYAVYHDDENVIALLSEIEARYAKMAVWGNRDYGGGAVRQYENVMEQAGFTVLKNGHKYVDTEDGGRILFTGLDDSMLGSPYLPGVEDSSAAEFKILLMHEPDSAADYSDYGYDIVLSGHSHGGQVNIPFLPRINKMALSATNLAADYSGGMYEPAADGSSRLYVNTGIGTTHISARFGVVPEITVFHIYL